MTVCTSVNCAAEARCVIHWPGAAPSAKCIECTQKALGVADTLGFNLPFDTEQEWLQKVCRRAEELRVQKALDAQVRDAARRLSEDPSEAEA